MLTGFMTTYYGFRQFGLRNKRILVRMQNTANKMTMRIVYLIILVFAGQVVYGGWYLREKSEDHFGNISYQSVFIQDGHIRIETDRSILLLDVHAGWISLVYPDKMCFWTGGYDTLRSAIISCVEDQLRVSIALLSISERELADAECDSMMTALKSDTSIRSLPAKIRIVPTDSMINISGLEANGYEVWIDSLVHERFWISRQIAPYQSIDLRKMEKMTNIFNQPGVMSLYRQSEEWLALIQLGVLVKSTIPTPVGESTSLLETAREVLVPSGFFDPPVEYRPMSKEEVLSNILDDGSAEKKDGMVVPEPPDPREYLIPENR